MSPRTNHWYRLSDDEALAELGSTPGGLSDDEAASRLQQYGPNELETKRGPSAWQIFAEQFKNILVIMLIAATVVSLFLGETVEAIAIAVIVIFSAVLGFVQEYQAERAIDALREMAAPNATVKRGGREVQVPARELVPGDVIILQTGDRIPADARLISSINLKVEEAALTGESVAIEKTDEPIDGEDLAVGDRRNMVYSGTAVSYGRGVALVTSTGMGTEFGKIAGMLQSVERNQTPLQENLDRVGRVLFYAAMAIVAIIVIVGLIQGRDLREMFLFGIALAVAAVPEALPAVVTISLAIGVQRMVKRNALIRRLPAVETLGSTTYICSDKTGTLTKDEMTVRKVYLHGDLIDVTGVGYEPDGSFSHMPDADARADENLRRLLRAAALCNDSALVRDEDGHWQIKGDPTEGALVVAAAKAGLDKRALDTDMMRFAEIPFSSETKRMTTLHSTDSGNMAFSKGAPEILIDQCVSYRTAAGDVFPLDADRRDEILQQARDLAAEAMRVLMIAERDLPEDTPTAQAENDLTFLGLLGMIDPPRPEAKAAIAKTRSAGIKAVMITGDHQLTATAVASELGLLNTGVSVTGAELKAMSDEELTRRVEEIEVYARVSPADKLRVVTALQQRGHIVAMTGDGVNDAPALKKADIGVAMGITGTDVTKEASEMMLTDDNFASIVSAVEEGRGIFGNIKKYLMYLLSANIGEMLIMGIATLAGLPLPLTAVQLLFINLATDGLPALALAVDPIDDDIMERKPRDPKTGIFTRPVVSLMLFGGIWSALVNLGLFVWAIGPGQRGADEAMTMVFITLVLIEFFKAYAFRSDRETLFKKPFENTWLNWAIVADLLLVLAIVYIPAFHEPFNTFSLTVEDWLILTPLAITIFIPLEVGKWMVRQGWLGELTD